MISHNINNRSNNSNNNNNSRSNSSNNNKINQEDIFLVVVRISNMVRIDHLASHLMIPRIHLILSMTMAKLSLSKSKDQALEQIDNSNHIERLS